MTPVPVTRQRGVTDLTPSCPIFDGTSTSLHPLDQPRAKRQREECLLCYVPTRNSQEIKWSSLSVTPSRCRFGVWSVRRRCTSFSMCPTPSRSHPSTLVTCKCRGDGSANPGPEKTEVTSFLCLLTQRRGTDLGVVRPVLLSTVFPRPQTGPMS